MLGRACTQSFRLWQASVGNEYDQHQFQTYQRTTSCSEASPSSRPNGPSRIFFNIFFNIRIFFKGPFYGTIVSQSVGGKEEMVVVPEDDERIQAQMEANSKFEVNQLMKYTQVRSQDEQQTANSTTGSNAKCGG